MSGDFVLDKPECSWIRIILARAGLVRARADRKEWTMSLRMFNIGAFDWTTHYGLATRVVLDGGNIGLALRDAGPPCYHGGRLTGSRPLCKEHILPPAQSAVPVWARLKKAHSLSRPAALAVAQQVEVSFVCDARCPTPGARLRVDPNA